MKRIECNLPDSLYDALIERMQTEKASCDHVVSTALSQCLGKQLHTLFQVSTSAALVEGLYQGAVRVSRLLRHGDFGLGTFIDLDGEMVVLEGVCYRISSDGAVTAVEGDRLIPYAVVTRFSTEFAKPSQQLSSFSELVAVCDALRSSENVFCAFRVEGKFSLVKARVDESCPSRDWSQGRLFGTSGIRLSRIRKARSWVFGRLDSRVRLVSPATTSISCPWTEKEADMSWSAKRST